MNKANDQGEEDEDEDEKATIRTIENEIVWKFSDDMECILYLDKIFA